MLSVLLVGAGGFLGAIARYGVTVGVGKLAGPSFPWGIMAANIAGSLFIGILAGIGDTRHIWSTEARLFLFIGVLGGFTTFSSLTNDTLALLRASNVLGALANIGITLAAGFTAVAAGYLIGKAGA